MKFALGWFTKPGQQPLGGVSSYNPYVTPMPLISFRASTKRPFIKETKIQSAEKLFYAICTFPSPESCHMSWRQYMWHSEGSVYKVRTHKHLTCTLTFFKKILWLTSLGADNLWSSQRLTNVMIQDPSDFFIIRVTIGLSWSGITLISDLSSSKY